MRYGILGTGDVARSIAGKLMELGHTVTLGSRTPDNPQAAAWAGQHGSMASAGTFADAARYGEVVFCCVQGIHALEALQSAGVENLEGKILIDQSNPYHYADGHISLDPRWSGTTSLGEEVQKLLPQTRVVKTLNYLHNHLMTHPQELPEPVTGFYCGNDAEAKAFVRRLLEDFGWQDTLNLGDISMSRYTEMLGAFWPAVYNSLGHMKWGFRLVR